MPKLSLAAVCSIFHIQYILLNTYQIYFWSNNIMITYVVNRFYHDQYTDTNLVVASCCRYAINCGVAED